MNPRPSGFRAQVLGISPVVGRSLSQKLEALSSSAGSITYETSNRSIYFPTPVWLSVKGDEPAYFRDVVSTQEILKE